MRLPSLNPFMLQHDEFITGLPPEECARRIKEARSNWKTIWLEPGGANPSWHVRGRVKRDGFRLFVEDFRSRTFRPIARGRFEPASKGTKIITNFGLHGTTVLFVVLCSLLPLAAGIISTVQIGMPGLDLLIAWIAVPVIAAIFYIIAAFAWRRASGQVDYLMRFLREVTGEK